MIKAIIALINKWAYRCEHEWVDQGTVNKFYNETCISKVFVYRCTKCCEFKKEEVSEWK